jgi:hypothetical protein
MSLASLKSLLVDPDLMQNKIKEVMTRLVRQDIESNERDP